MGTTESILMAIILVFWFGLIAFLTPTALQSDTSLSKPLARLRIGEAMLKILGVIMSALDDALARFTTFVKDVVAQLTATKETNDAQTGKLAELQAALDTALADDNADKAAIAALQAEVSSLQDSVAAQINAAIDALNAAPTEPAVDPVTETPVEDAPVE
jgi:chromosome segregation ATPase